MAYFAMLAIGDDFDALLLICLGWNWSFISYNSFCLILGYYLHEKFIMKKVRKAYGEKIVPYLYHANAQPNAT